jgi:hypothetical protein
VKYIRADYVPLMILRLYSLAYDILSAHCLLRVGDKTDLTFPALSCEPKMTQVRKPAHLGNLVLDVNLVSLGSVIDDLTRVYVVHLK